MAATGRGRRRGSIALALGVTLACGYFAVRGVDVNALLASVRDCDYRWLAPALVVLAMGFFVRVVRWRSLFPGASPGLWPMTEALLVAQLLNNVLPLRVGEAARVVVLHSRAGRSRAETAATVVVERVFDVLALVFLLLAALPLFPELRWIAAAAAAAGALTVGIVVAVVVLRAYRERPLRFVLGPLRRLPWLSPARIESAIEDLMRGLAGVRSARVGVVAFAWTLLSWLVLGVSFWFVTLAFHLELSPSAGLLVVIATGLSLLLPSAPAAVGVFEAAAVVALAAYGVSHADALSYALVLHALNVLPFVAAGLLVLNADHGLLVPRVRSRQEPARGDVQSVARAPRRGVGADRGAGD